MIRVITAWVVSIVGVILVLPGVVLMVPVWVFGALVNGINNLLARRGTPWDRIVQFEPEIGWKPRPNLNTTYTDRVGDRCTIQTDAEGWPGTHTIEASDVVVFGDSFAFGYGSSVDQAFYSMAKEYRIKAIGAPGYTMVQELLWMKRYANRLRGKRVVWFVCVENDLAENLKAYNPALYTNPFLRSGNGVGDWEVVSEHVQLNRWRQGDGGIGNILLFAHICTPCPYSDRVFSAAKHLIREGRETCIAAGAELVVFSIPYRMQLGEAGVRDLKQRLKAPETFDPEYVESMLTGICAELKVPFIAGTSRLTLRDYKAHDGHWNTDGNRRVAQVIEDYCRTGAPVR